MARSASARRIDLAICGGLLVLGQLEVTLGGSLGDVTATRALWAFAAVAALWRRRPLLFFATALAVHALAVAFDLSAPGGGVYSLYPPLALFGLGAYVRNPRHAVAAAAAGLVSLMALRVGLDLAGLLRDRADDEWVRELGIYAPAAAGGVVLRDRTESLRAARRRAAQTAGSEEQAVGAALARERTRIAQELHAVVRGCVRAVLADLAAVRAAAGTAFAPPRPATGAAPPADATAPPGALPSDTARVALRRARDASQQAMAEMRRMLVLLRSDAADEPAGPRTTGSPAPPFPPASVGGAGPGRPDAADVPATIADLAASGSAGSRIAVRRSHAAAPFADVPLGAVAMRVLVAFTQLPGCTRIVIERGDGAVRAHARAGAPFDAAAVEALAERARLAGGRLRRGMLRRDTVVLTLPVDAAVARDPVEPLPWSRLPRLVRAQALPLLLLVVEVGEAVMNSNGTAAEYGTASPVVRVLGAVALAAAFLPRRRWPLATVVLAVAVMVVRTNLLSDWFGLNPPSYLAAFVAGAYARSMVAAVVGGLVVVVSMPALVVVTFPGDYPVYVYLFFVTMIGAAWMAGVGGRRRLAEAAELRELTAQEERRQARQVADAVNAERLRVARELHDLVGHGLTSITLQCAAAEQVLERRPAEAARAVDAAEQVCREVLGELRQLLAALDGDERELPDLARLPQLARRAEAEGLRVRLALDGDLDAVPPGHAGAAYRIVQEALTNARKHAGPVDVGVHVALARSTLAIEVRNSGGAPATAPDGPGGGLGLAGMRERVRVYDGWLAAGPDERGGWAVRAELPVG
jgi:signal transduction histidine kinase